MRPRPSASALCVVVLAAGVLPLACSRGGAETRPQPAPDRAAGPAAAETVTVRDPELEARVARLELGILEREGQLEGLQAQLDEARREVVRAMAKLQTIASRAEAASAMAEAEIALQALRTAAAQQPPPEVAQAHLLLQQSAAEFDQTNYGGALYLANQAKTLAGAGQGRLLGGEPGSLRSGEVLFALPLKLQAMGRSNVRDGPGTGFRIVFTVEAGGALTGYSYVNQWVRVTDESGRSGWILSSRVGKRP